jgi:hypothetical protein
MRGADRAIAGAWLHDRRDPTRFRDGSARSSSRGDVHRDPCSRPMGQHEGGSGLVERVQHVIVHPARVTELERRPHAAGQPNEHVSQELGVAGQRGRQLEQHGSQGAPELTRPLPESRDRIRRIPQAPNVGEVAAHLDREHEPRGHLRRPRREGVRRRKPVERGVDLDRRHASAEVREPRSLGQALGVDVLTPVAVDPAARPDEHRPSPFAFSRPTSDISTTSVTPRMEVEKSVRPRESALISTSSMITSNAPVTFRTPSALNSTRTGAPWRHRSTSRCG